MGIQLRGFNVNETQKLGEQTLTATATGFTSFSIPTGYKYLIIYFSTLADLGVSQPVIQLNGETGGVYQRQNFSCAGAVVASSAQANQTSQSLTGGANDTVWTQGTVLIDLTSAIHHIQSFCHILSETYLNCGKFTGTAGDITSVLLRSASNNFDTGSKVVYYGVK